MQAGDHKAELRALMTSPQPTLPDYWQDPAVERRVGEVLANLLTLAHEKSLDIGREIIWRDRF